MSVETYYTVLNIREAASPAEIKKAYRDLIKQVHPDTKPNLAPHLKKIAEDKAKEIIEAYTVLSSATKRRDYDRLLAEYRRQTMPPVPPGSKTTPPPTASAMSFGYCKKCGTSLYASGYCPRCGKFASPAATPAASSPRPQAVRWLNWASYTRLWREHPWMYMWSLMMFVRIIFFLFPDANTRQSQANTLRSPENNPSSFLTGSDTERRDQSVPATVPKAPPKTKRLAKTPAGIFAVATGRYGATIYKRCAFLPFEDYSRCSFGHEQVAQLKQGGRVRVLSPLTEAQTGAYVYKVRTRQGWEGWARAEDLTLQKQ